MTSRILGKPNMDWLPGGNPQIFWVQGKWPSRARDWSRLLPQIRTCQIKASGSSMYGRATGPRRPAEATCTPLRLPNGVTATGIETTRDFAWFPPLGPSVTGVLSSTGSLGRIPRLRTYYCAVGGVGRAIPKPWPGFAMFASPHFPNLPWRKAWRKDIQGFCGDP
jgi:hypothetical protein